MSVGSARRASAFQVNADAVHAGLEHATRDFDGLRGRALMRHHGTQKRAATLEGRCARTRP